MAAARAGIVPRRSTRRRVAVEVFSARAVLGGALLWLGLACQSEAAPAVRSEPAREPAPVSAPAAPTVAAPAAGSVAAASAAAAPSVATAEAAGAPAGAVGLAKYQPASVGTPAGTAPASQGAPAADGPTPPAAGQPIQGAAVSEDSFSVWLQSVSPVVAGRAATIEAVLVAKPPYHCNADYPHKFKLAAAPAGLSYPETTVKGAKVSPEKSVLPIVVQAQSPGKAKVSGTLSFSVCNDERCLVEKRDLAIELEVK